MLVRGAKWISYEAVGVWIGRNETNYHKDSGSLIRPLFLTQDSNNMICSI